jgi:hypothetical protein
MNKDRLYWFHIAAKMFGVPNNPKYDGRFLFDERWDYVACALAGYPRPHYCGY